MNSKDYLALTQRDAKVVDSLSSALRVMRIINGSAVEIGGRLSALRLEDTMLKLHGALQLLGVDSDEVS